MVDSEPSMKMATPRVKAGRQRRGDHRTLFAGCSSLVVRCGGCAQRGVAGAVRRCGAGTTWSESWRQPNTQKISHSPSAPMPRLFGQAGY
jgi:hypothetical protein